MDSQKGKAAFSIAEALITLMIISLILAAVIPVMSKRQLTSDSMWRYTDSGTGANSNIYYGQGSAQTAIIGASVLPDSSKGSRLVLVTPLPPDDAENDDTIRRSILDFEQKTPSGVVNIGKISFDHKNNISIGSKSLLDSTKGESNVAVGTFTLNKNTQGNNNTAVGYAALYKNTKNSNDNSAFGYSSLGYNETGSSNTAIGNSAMFFTKSGQGNTAIGDKSMFGEDQSSPSHPASTGGVANTAVGRESLRGITTGVANVALGATSLLNNKNGNRNVAIGTNALGNNMGGSENTAVGFNSCSEAHFTSRNICLGMNSGPTSDGVGDKLFIDVEQTDEPLIYGDFASKNVRINGSFNSDNNMVAESDLTVLGEAEFRGTATFLGSIYAQAIYASSYEKSDKRLKNIYGDNNVGIEKLNQLQVKNYVFKSDKKKKPKVGVIAQDLQKIFPNSVVKGPDGYLYVDTNEIFYAMLNAVRDTYKQVQSIIVKVSGLDKKITKLEKENKELNVQIVQIQKQNVQIKQQIAQTNKQNAIINQRLKKLEAK